MFEILKIRTGFSLPLVLFLTGYVLLF